MVIRAIALVGLVLSAYAVFVEYKVHHLQPGEEFTALCDIDALKASCRYVPWLDAVRWHRIFVLFRILSRGIQNLGNSKGMLCD